MPSLEMLKKLLDEFSEKEAHTREEINVITEQIGELEKRILTSQQKLSTVAADREKVRAMQARYGGGSTLTPGTPLLGSKPSAAEQPEEAKETPRPRPGRAGSGATGVDASGLPVAPLNVRASQTRIPAMTPPEPVAETPATTSGLFGTLEAAAAAAPIAPAAAPAQPKAFSPLDLFGSPSDESVSAPAAGVSVPAAAEPPPPLPGVGDYQSGVQYNAGNSYEYQNAQPLDAFPPAGTAPLAPPTAPVTPATPVPSPIAPTPAASTAPASGTSSIGEITTSFFTPLGSTEATLQPSAPLTQPVDAAAQHSLFLDPNQQPAPATQPEDSAQIQDLDEDEPDDTVKSINDALRGLFR